MARYNAAMITPAQKSTVWGFQLDIVPQREGEGRGEAQASLHLMP